MKENAETTITAEQAQKILAEGGLIITLQEAIVILCFLDKLAQITIEVYTAKPQ